MGAHHSSLVKWVMWCIIGVQNEHLIKYDIMLWKLGDYKRKILGSVANYPFSLGNVYNY